PDDQDTLGFSGLHAVSIRRFQTRRYVRRRAIGRANPPSGRRTMTVLARGRPGELTDRRRNRLLGDESVPQQQGGRTRSHYRTVAMQGVDRHSAGGGGVADGGFIGRIREPGDQVKTGRRTTYACLWQPPFERLYEGVAACVVATARSSEVAVDLATLE